MQENTNAQDEKLCSKSTISVTLTYGSLLYVHPDSRIVFYFRLIIYNQCRILGVAHDPKL
jgi:hypothetical protein